MLAVVQSAGTISIYNNQLEPYKTLPLTPGELTFLQLAFSANQEMLAVARAHSNFGTTISVYNIRTGVRVFDWRDRVGRQSVVAMSFRDADSQLIAFVRGARLLRWDTRNWRALPSSAIGRELGEENPDWGMFDATADSLIYSFNSVVVSRALSKGALHWIASPDSAFSAMVFPGPSGYFATLEFGGGDEQSVINVRNRRNGKIEVRIAGDATPIESLSVSPDQRWLVGGMRNDRIVISDLATGDNKIIDGGGAIPAETAITPNSQTLAYSKDKSVVVYDLQSQTVSTELPARGFVSKLAFSPGEQWLIASLANIQTGPGAQTAVEVWATSTWTESVTTSPRRENLLALSFGSADDKLVTASDRDVQLLQIPSGQLQKTLSGCMTAAFSPTGSAIVVGNPGCNNPTPTPGLNRSNVSYYVDSSSLMKIGLGAVDSQVEFFTNTPSLSQIAFNANGRYLATTGNGSTQIDLLDAGNGEQQGNLSGHTDWVSGIAFGSPTTFFSSSWDGTIRIWSLSTLSELGRFILMGDNDWIVATPDGHFDTNNLTSMASLHWVFPGKPGRALSPEVFIRDYYEPQLLPRLLGGETLHTVRPLSSLNLLQPLVEIVSAEWLDAAKRMARIKVRVDKNADPLPTEARNSTDAYDLRIFRDDQLVAEVPDAARGRVSNGFSLPDWRCQSHVPLEADGSATLTFDIQVPRWRDLTATTFSAYAFNEDRVKSRTSSFPLATTGSTEPRQGNAYIISVGVNHVEGSPEWNLRYAASDARKYSETLRSSLLKSHRYNRVTTVKLISEYKKSQQASEMAATKQNLKRVLDSLAGRSSTARSQGLNGIDRAQPEDLIVITFSAHGFKDRDGVYHMVLGDIGPRHRRDHLTQALVDAALSTDDLAEWLNGIDAADFVMIIDACDAEAAVVSSGFKPAPIGTRGLGQLAYDKGMQILAASKLEQGASEVGGSIKEGLLSYVLLHEGLELGMANVQNAQEISLSDWLQYGAREVPKLIHGRNSQGGGAAPSKRAEVPFQSVAWQEPVFFNFARHHRPVFMSTN
jgi:WD40 repeat protein